MMLKQITGDSSTTMQLYSNTVQNEQKDEPIPPFSDERLALLKDIFKTMVNTLRAKDLEAFGSTCKQLKTITDNSDMWKLVFEDINNFRRLDGIAELAPPEISYKTAIIEELKKGSPYAFLSVINFRCDNKYAKSKIEETIKLINIFPKPPSISFWMHAKLKLYHAKLLMKASQYEPIVALLNRIFENNASLPEDITVANSILAQLGYYLENSYMTDNVIQKKLAETAMNEKLSKIQRLDAKLYDCFMALQARASSFTKIMALECLQDICNDVDASIDQRAHATVALAAQFYKQREYEKANKLISIIQNDSDINEKIHLYAKNQYIYFQWQKI